MQRNVIPPLNSPELYVSCDILLMKLFFKAEVSRAFPDFPEEAVAELQRCGLITEKGPNLVITERGKKIVRSGGVKSIMTPPDSAPANVLVLKRYRRIFDYPISIIIVMLSTIICILTWLLVFSFS